MATPTRFPQTCDVLAGDIKTDPFTVVLFGGAGDLARRMILPSLYHLHHDKLLPEDFSIIGFGLPAMSDEAYRVFAREALEEFLTGPLNNGQWSILSRHLFYVSSAFDADSGYKELYRRTGQVCTVSSEVKKEVIFYLAVPPPFAPVIIQKLAAHKLCEDTFQPKVVLEKPFGRDRASAADLNRAVLEVFEEQQVYRIDHYLGKETVQNILFFRFANSIFEPLWNRRYIDQVQITVAEEIGIGHRGLFYDQTGVVRDIVQNHIMQLLALVAMEPPVGFEADFVRDEKVKVFRTVRPMDKQYIQQYTVRGQYGPGKIRGREIKGYREEPHVAPDSITPTLLRGKTVH